LTDLYKDVNIKAILLSLVFMPLDSKREFNKMRSRKVIVSNQLPESLVTATIKPTDELGGRIVFRSDFQKLFRDIIVESAECLIFLQENPDHTPYLKGAVSTGNLLNPLWEPGMPIESAFIPQISENVRMWPIPSTSLFLTDLGGDIVATDKNNELSYIKDPLNFDTKAELEQLLVGLRAMRD
jgi:hypothetical protein